VTVYYARLEDTGRIKIGHAEDAYRRAHTLVVQFKTSVTLLATEPGGFDREEEVLEEFAFCLYPGAGEIFLPSPALLARIESLKIEPYHVRHRTRAQRWAEYYAEKSARC